MLPMGWDLSGVTGSSEAELQKVEWAMEGTSDLGGKRGRRPEVSGDESRTWG